MDAGISRLRGTATKAAATAPLMSANGKIIAVKVVAVGPTLSVNGTIIGIAGRACGFPDPC